MSKPKITDIERVVLRKRKICETPGRKNPPHRATHVSQVGCPSGAHARTTWPLRGRCACATRATTHTTPSSASARRRRQHSWGYGGCTGASPAGSSVGGATDELHAYRYTVKDCTLLFLCSVCRDRWWTCDLFFFLWILWFFPGKKILQARRWVWIFRSAGDDEFWEFVGSRNFMTKWSWQKCIQ